MEGQKYIYLYADEFTSDVWSGYCNVLGVPVGSSEIKIFVSSVEVLS